MSARAGAGGCLDQDQISILYIKTLSIIMLSIFSRMNLFEFNGGAVTFIIYKSRFDDTTYFNTYNLISFIVY